MPIAAALDWMTGRLRIIDADGHLIPFVPNPNQMTLYRWMARQAAAGYPIRIIILKARQLGMCLHPETRILTAGLRWVPLGDIGLGDELVACDEGVPGGKGHHRRMRTSTVEAIRTVSEPAFRLHMSNGQELVATGQHRFLCRARGGTETVWRRVGQMRVGDSIRHITEPWGDSGYEDGWFGGFVDGEGSFRPKTRAGVELTVSQVKNSALERARAYLESRNYAYRLEEDKRKSGDSSKLGNQIVVKAVVGRMNELFRLLGQCRPARFIGQRWWEGKELPGKRSGVAWAEVVAIEPLPKQQMIDLQTSTKTFVAEGFVSHNSTAVQALFFALTHLLANHRALIASLDDESSTIVFDMAKTMHEELGSEAWPTKSSTKKIIHYRAPQRSWFRAITAGKENLGRSLTLQYFHGSEVAGWAKDKAALTAVLRCVHELLGTIVVLESTAKGVGGEFHGRWVTAEKRMRRNPHDLSGYIPLFFSWLDEPEYRTAVPESYDWRFLETIGPEIVRDEPELRRRGATDEQLYWRRHQILEAFNGDIDMFKQEMPSCVAGDARISTIDGIVPMRQGRAGGAITHWWPKGTAEVWRVQTSLGYEVKATSDHRFCSAGTFMRLDSLSPGLALTLRPPEFSQYEFIASWGTLASVTTSVRITPSWGRLLGYFMGDGCFHKHSLEFACSGDADVRSDIKGLIEDLGGTNWHEQEIGRKHGNAWRIRTSSQHWATVLRMLGCLKQRASDGGWRRHVRVPECIWQSPRNVVREFLRGLFEADGFNGYGTPRVMFFAKDEQFAKDVQLLLLAFGITCRRTSVIKCAGDGHKYAGNELALRRNEAIAFNERIGFVSQRKRSRHDPADIKRRQALTGRRAPKNALPLVMRDTILSIEPAGEEEVFDLSVEEGQVFSANGILVHNCPAEAFIASGRPAIPSIIVDYHRSTVEHEARDYDSPGRAYRKCNLHWDKRCDSGVRPEYGSHILEPCWRIWVPPHEDADYVVAGDIARGELSDPKDERSKPDWSAGFVMDRTSLEQVAEYMGRILPGEMGDELLKACWWYGRAWGTPEVNDAGRATLARFRDTHYQRTYRRMREDDHLDVEDVERLGWQTTSGNRKFLIDKWLEYCKPSPEAGWERSIVIRSARLVDQESTFIFKPNGKREHRAGYFDDILFAAMISLQLHLHCGRTIVPRELREPKPDTLARYGAVDWGVGRLEHGDVESTS